jgi:hypothetical protein
MRRRLIWLLLVISVIALSGTAIQAENRPKLVIFLFNHVSWDDLLHAKADHLGRLIREGAVGWMNVKNYSGYLPASSYMTIGMSSRTRLDDRAGAAYDVDESLPYIPGITGGDLFKQLTGADPIQGGVVVPEIARIKSVTAEIEPQAVPGLLGKTLVEKGKRIALFGNADLPGEVHREAALMVMTPSGRISMGCVGPDILLNDAKALFGWRTNYDQIFAKMKSAWNKADLILVETGDTSRVELVQDLMTPERASALRRQAIRKADPFIGRVLRELQPDACLLLGVNPNRQMIKEGNTGLAPILLYGKGRGYLSSASTHRSGYVTSLDLYATICALLGIDLAEQGKGFVMTVDPFRTDLDSLVQEEVFFKNLRNIRYPVNDGLTILFLLGVLGGIIGIWQGYSPRVTRGYLTGIIALLLLPVGALLGGLAGYEPIWPMLGLALGSSGLVALILTRLFPFRRALVIVLFTVPLLLLADVFTGGQWMLRSVMGSDLIAGGRFFGMGNDLMGVVIGSLTAGIGMLTQELPALRSSARWWGTLLMLGAVAGIGLPIFGANVGGMIAALMTSVVTLLVLMDIQISWKKAGMIFIGVVGLVVLVATGDAFFNPRPTHAGRAIRLLLSEGGQGFLWIVSNKLGILGRTIATSMWSWLCMVELIAFGAVKRWIPQLLPDLKERYPQWWKMMKPLGVGCFFAFAVNDTGIIAAALIFSYFWLTACGLYLEATLVPSQDVSSKQGMAL